MKKPHFNEATKSDLITVSPTTKIEAVAKLFDERDINAAPVVDGIGKCVGVITSHDLVQYEANRREFESQSLTGIVFDIAPGCDDQPDRLVGCPFDEVSYHMSTVFGTIREDSPVSDAGRLMCQQHFHHLVVLNGASRPVHMLSSLDVIGDLLDEPVLRLDHAGLLKKRSELT